MDSTYVEFELSANVDTGYCATLKEFGCTDSFASNFDSLANTNDHSCIAVIEGCLDLAAINYNDYDDDLVPNILTNNPLIDINTNVDALCEYEGCMEDWADNYDSLATTDNGTCVKLSCILCQ